MKMYKVFPKCRIAPKKTSICFGRDARRRKGTDALQPFKKKKKQEQGG